MFRNLRFDEACQLLGGPVEPEPDEKKNGWNTESLTIFVAEQNLAVSSRILDPVPERQTGTITKMRWLRR